MPYVAAYTLVHGAPFLAAFTEESIHDEKVRSAARLVAVAIDPEFADIYEESPSRIIVTFRDGSKVEKLRYYASGTPQFPLTHAQIEQKFMDCADHAVSKETATKIFATLQSLGQAPSFEAFWPLVRRA
jgi:2-methylcitrate dehydratase PrpD